MASKSIKIVRYEHHGESVSVMRHLKGKHRKHCLCWANCVHFKPGDPDNCQIAERLFQLCVDTGIVAPVHECPDYDSDEYDVEDTD